MNAAKLSRYVVLVVGLVISAAGYASNNETHINDFGQGKIAPDLTQQIKTLSEEDFTRIVTNGKGLMPPWKANQEVMHNMRNMYRYLKARSNGVLQEGIPMKPR